MPKLAHECLRLLSNMGNGGVPPGSRIPPSNQSVSPTTLAPTPFSQLFPAAACSIVCVRMRPSASKSNINRPVNALLGSAPRLRPVSRRDRAIVLASGYRSEPAEEEAEEGGEREDGEEDGDSESGGDDGGGVLRFSHQRTTSCSAMAPERRGRKVRGSDVMRSARISSLTLPIIGTRFQAMGDVQRAAL